MSTPYHLTPGASQGNAFTRHYRPEPSIFARDQAFATNASVRASQAREASEARGINVAQIHGMGSDAYQNVDRAKFHVAPKTLDCRGRAFVDLAPRTVGAISISKTSAADLNKNQRIRKASL